MKRIMISEIEELSEGIIKALIEKFIENYLVDYHNACYLALSLEDFMEAFTEELSGTDDEERIKVLGRIANGYDYDTGHWDESHIILDPEYYIAYHAEADCYVSVRPFVKTDYYQEVLEDYIGLDTFLNYCKESYPDQVIEIE